MSRVAHRCIDQDELERVRALPPGDPHRLEVEACPRCNSLLRSYAEFLEDRSVPPAADPERAAPHLRQAFERALEGAAGPPRPAVEHSAPALQAGRRPRIEAPPKGAWWAPLLGPRLAWSASAVLVVVLGVYAGARWQERTRGEEVLRTDSGPGAARAGDRPLLLAPRAVSAGLELRWTPAADADGYRVVFLGEDLTRIAELGPLPDTLMVLVTTRLPAGLSAGSTVAWQVEALQGGFVIAASETAVLKLP